MLADRRFKRKPAPGMMIQRSGVLAVPAPAPTSAILSLIGAGFRADACPAQFAATNGDGEATELLDDSNGAFAKLGFTGSTLAEADAFLKSLPRDPDQDKYDAALRAALEAIS